MLFIKPIDQITFEDIENFCKEGLEESSRLEYKKDFSSKDANFQIAKEIASFANTYGGLLLIGINELDRKPKLPLEGIKYEEGLNERINSIALSNIYPPVFPEVKVCQFQDQEKAVIVIRVSQSDETPHLLNKRTKIYVKVDSQSEPIEPPWEQIEWLINKRQKAIENKERLINRSRERFKFLCEGKPVTSFGEIFALPIFPSTRLVDFSNLKTVAKNSSYSGFNYSFPPYLSQPRIQPESLIYSEMFPLSAKVDYLEVNQFGLIYYKKNLWEELDTRYKNKIGISSVLQMIFHFLSYVKSFYKNINYWGVLQITFKLEGILGKSLFYESNPNSIEYFANISKLYDNELTINRKLLAGELIESLDNYIADIHSEFLLSCGADEIAQKKDQILDQIKSLRRGY
jgi:hypothetical protein